MVYIGNAIEFIKMEFLPLAQEIMENGFSLKIKLVLFVDFNFLSLFFNLLSLLSSLFLCLKCAEKKDEFMIFNKGFLEFIE